MATIPRYEPQSQMRAMPGPDVAVIRKPETAIGEGLESLGNAALSTGNKLADLAIKKQEEVDAMEFNLAKAKADSFFDQQWEQEKNNPDYDGMNGRVEEAFKKYSEDSLAGLSNDRVRQRVSQYLPIAREASRGKFTGLLFAKQEDKKLSLFNQGIEEAVKRLDFAEAKRIVGSATWMEESKKQAILSKTEKLIQMNEAKGILRADPEAKLDRSKYTTFDTDDWEEIEGIQESEKAERERVKKEEDADRFSKAYEVVRSRSLGSYSKTVEYIKAQGFEPKMKWALVDEAGQEYGVRRDGTRVGGSGGGGGGTPGGVKPGKTDPKAYKEILGMIAHNTLFSTYKSAGAFFDIFKDKLSNSVMDEILKAYKKAGADDTTDLITLTTKSSVDKAIPKSIKDDEEKYVHFIRTYNEEAKRRIRKNGAMSILDQVKLAKDLATEVTVDKGSFAEVWHDPNGNFFDVTKMRYELVRNAQGKVGYINDKGKWVLAPEGLQD